MSLPQSQDGICLCYPGPLGFQASVTHESAASMLLRAIQLASQTPFSWSYIDKPAEGQMYLIFVPPQLSFPLDGIRYQEQEQRYVIPVGNGRDLEVMEIKFGFVPGHDTTAFRVRRRYRLVKGGHPQLILIHYSRGQAAPILPSLDAPVRRYPLRPYNEPPVYVMGEKAGQKVYPGAGAAGGPAGGPPSAMGMGFPLAGNPQAMLAQQNSNMESLERRTQRERDRSGSRVGPRMDDDDSADESDMISTRTLALTRYRRNHEYMNEVFMHAAFGKQKEAAPPKAAYSVFNKDELEDRVAKLSSEIDELKAAANTRAQSRARRIDDAGDVSMEGLTADASM